MANQKLSPASWEYATPETVADESALSGELLSVKRRVLTAELNAGVTLIPAIAGKAINIFRMFAISNGAFNSGGGTSVIVQDSADSPIVVMTYAKAALTAGARISSTLTVSNVTAGAGITGMTSLTAGKALVIPADASLSTGTSVDLFIDYFYTNA